MQIYDLTLSDLEKFPAWYFPMDDTGEDELSIRPSSEIDQYRDNFQEIIRTSFVDSSGKLYTGYIYWCGTDDISVCQPVLFFSENKYLAFWAGALAPEWNEGGPEALELAKNLPISFQSEDLMGLSTIRGVLKGLYYLDENGEITFV